MDQYSKTWLKERLKILINKKSPSVLKKSTLQSQTKGNVRSLKALSKERYQSLFSNILQQQKLTKESQLKESQALVLSNQKQSVMSS